LSVKIGVEYWIFNNLLAKFHSSWQPKFVFRRRPLNFIHF